MKLFLLSLLACVPLLAPDPVRAEETVSLMPVWDFVAQPPVYGYEGWEDLAAVGTKTPEGWELKGNAQGGVGVYFNELLSLESANRLRFRVIVHSANTEDRLLVKLHTADGRSAAWYVPLSGVEPDQEISLSLDLAKPDESVAAEPIDLGIIKQIQVQGTFNPGKKVSLTLVRIEAEQKP